MTILCEFCISVVEVFKVVGIVTFISFEKSL